MKATEDVSDRPTLLPCRTVSERLAARAARLAIAGTIWQDSEGAYYLQLEGWAYLLGRSGWHAERALAALGREPLLSWRGL
jgi:hypothetical protein